MSSRIRLVLLILILVVFLSPAWGQGQAPFVPGEVAVYATPDELPGQTVAKFLPAGRITVLKTQPGREFGLAQRLRESGFVAGVNLRAQAFQTAGAVNDPLYSPYQWHLAHVQSEQVWPTAIGSGAKVAVLDTGLATNGSRDGIGCVVAGYDFVNGDNDPVDGDGHGTHVSGTIAQATNNHTGVAGLAYGSCIMPVKVLDDSGSGSFSDIAAGIYWAVDAGANVINMSLGINARFGITSDPIMNPALDYAYAHDVTVVCASGNDGSRKNVSYPASYNTTIAVGATDYANQVTRYSNKGTGLDLVAPGGDSADLNGDGYMDGVLQETFGTGGWGYYFFTGTSMASPHVAAAAAILIGAGSATTPDEVYSALTGSALDLGVPGYDSTSGYGLLQVFDALGGVGPIDADGDGFIPPDDCNEGDPSINPGASEICGDFVDNNCDGVIDEGCAVGGCTDQDGDGWCVEDGDCNDADPQVYPGHQDSKGRWGRDGVDNDCNGIIDG